MEDEDNLNETPFFRFHRDLGAKIVEFAGWRMPLQYTGILAEHRAVRSRIGLFDVSHMGRLEVRGENAYAFVHYMTTNDVLKLEAGEVQYSTICNESGGILDDITIYRHPGRLFLVVNASNTDKITSWLARHLWDGVELIDRTAEIAQLALQGPDSQGALQRLTSIDLEEIPFYQFATGDVVGIECTVSRTGYTGEDGFEIYLSSDHARELWSALMASGEILPCGLGARDLLRLEVNYCLYGNDIDESTSPLEAGLGWLVKMDKEEFIGRDALQEIQRCGIKRRLVGFSLIEKGIPRPGYPILRDGEVVSRVASGAFSPSLGVGIGTAYLPVEIAGSGSRIEVEIRDRRVPAEVVQPPFYRDGSRR